MSRILAIDYGSRRTGVAVTDPLQLIASSLATVSTNEVLTYLKAYCESENVSTIVVGQPRRMSGEFSEIESKILEFITKLKGELPSLNVVRFDERFTSIIAVRSMIESGRKKKDRRDKSQLDSISATLILQDYLSSIK